MKKFSFTIVALLLTVACLFLGCREASEPPKVVFVEGCQSEKEQEIVFGKAVKGNELPILCIDSKEAMNEFSQRTRENFYMTEGTTGESVELPTIVGYNDAVAPYTEEFFKEKSLIVSFVYVTSSPAYFEVSNISIQEGKLTILVDAFAVGVNTAMEGRFILIELPKSDLEGVTEFVALRDVGEVA